jgi:cyclopropane fatty-acyl-phospholipid synthase-like methyltransferase
MGFFDIEENVNEYIELAEGFDGAILINELKNHLPQGSSVLELGMGPGKDLDLLSKQYTVTGSDSSNVFINLYRKKNEQADLEQPRRSLPFILVREQRIR